MLRFYLENVVGKIEVVTLMDESTSVNSLTVIISTYINSQMQT
jgi:hypothetical protein